MRKVAKVQHDDVKINLIQDRILEGLNFSLSNVLTDAQLIDSLSLTTGNNVVSHKLGRKLLGWFVVRINAAITLFDTQATNLLSDKTLNLTASGPAIASLVVF